MRLAALVAGFSMLALSAFAADAAKYAKDGFYVHIHDGRLWVLKDGDPDIELVSKNKEPKEVTTRIAAGPDGMTIKSNKGEVIDAYMAK